MNIAVGLVTAAISVDLVLIISADSDLCPAVRAAREASPDLGLIAAFPPRRSSFELAALIPGNFMIGQDKIRRSQLPSIVVDSDTGTEWHRPKRWS